MSLSALTFVFAGDTELWRSDCPGGRVIVTYVTTPSYPLCRRDACTLAETCASPCSLILRWYAVRDSDVGVEVDSEVAHAQTHIRRVVRATLPGS